MFDKICGEKILKFKINSISEFGDWRPHFQDFSFKFVFAKNFINVQNPSFNPSRLQILHLQN